MVGYYNQGVPTTADLENNSNQKKYTVNRKSDKGLSISKPLCVLMAIGALLLAVLVGLVVFFLVPRYCNGDNVPEALQRAQIGGTKSVSLLKSANQGRNSALEPDDDVDERLPRSIDPVHYRIRLIPDVDNSTTFGMITMTLAVLDDTREVIFNVKNITVDQHSTNVLSSQDSSQIAISSQDYLPGDKYRIALTKSLIKGQQYNVSMNFTSELSKHLQGFYKSRYTDREGYPRYILSTQFSPTDARKVFPCFDEPFFKSVFAISLARPASMTTLSNMPIKEVAPFDGKPNWFWDNFRETPKMSSYLVAFMVLDLIHGPNSNIQVWTRPHFQHYTKYASDIAPVILEYFEEYFKIKFPLPKIDIVAVPEFGFSAMENWGLITFRESSLLFDPSTSTNNDKRIIATVLAHEIAHQWFGNLVTPKWWNDLWLKEGFATYLEYLGVNAAEPSWKIIEEFLPSETQRAMEIDSLASARPISFDVKNNRQIRQTFDVLSYAKGACIIRMMNHFLGETVFKNGLIDFLNKYQYKNADTYDLFDALTTEATRTQTIQPNETVKEIMEAWTKKPGFPVVHAVPDYKQNKLKLIQRRFYMNGTKESSKWWVPISFTTDKAANFSDTKPKFWLKGVEETETDVEFGQWYLLNIQYTGYFIVNYDEQNWHNLIEYLMTLPAPARAQLISDSMDLARANLLSYDIPLRMIAKMAVQDESIMIIPTIMALDKLQFLNDILANTAAYGLFEEYHQSIFKKTYEKVTFDDGVDDYITRRIRSTVLPWHCRTSDTKCSHEARTAYRDWMIKGIKITPNLRDVVYCTAIREGGEEEWDFAYRKYLESQSPSEKNILLDALGCTKLKWLLSRYLEKLWDDSIRVQDADRVFESVAKNEFGNQIAFDFLRENWDGLLQRYGDGFNILAKMVKSVARHMNSKFQLSDLIDFRDSLKTNISTTSLAFDSSIEIVRANVEWMEKNYHVVDEWFNKHKDYYTYI